LSTSATCATNYRGLKRYRSGLEAIIKKGTARVRAREDSKFKEACIVREGGTQAPYRMDMCGASDEVRRVWRSSLRVL
jgi:hypothetical protein